MEVIHRLRCNWPPFRIRIIIFNKLLLIKIIQTQSSTATQSCLVMNNQDPDQCVRCDESLGYFLFLRTPQITQCAYKLNTTHCKTLDEANNSSSNSVNQIRFVNGTQNGSGYCMDRELYKNQSGQVMCSGKQSSLSAGTQDLINQIGKDNLICSSCDNPLFNNEAVIAYPQPNLLFGFCNKTIGNLPGCKFNQYRDDLKSECKNCSNKFENCFSCDSARCLVCNPNF